MVMVTVIVTVMAMVTVVTLRSLYSSLAVAAVRKTVLEVARSLMEARWRLAQTSTASNTWGQQLSWIAVFSVL